jgi:hypothetical protein
LAEKGSGKIYLFRIKIRGLAEGGFSTVIRVFRISGLLRLLGYGYNVFLG